MGTSQPDPRMKPFLSPIFSQIVLASSSTSSGVFLRRFEGVTLPTRATLCPATALACPRSTLSRLQISKSDSSMTFQLGVVFPQI